VRVQERIKYSPPPSGNELDVVDDPQDNTLDEVRDLFASDALEEV
jgi:hypothetical protein